MSERYRLERLPNFIAQKEVRKHKKTRSSVIVKRAKLIQKLNRTLKLNDAKEKAFVENYQSQIVERAKGNDRELRTELSKLSAKLTSLQNIKEYFLNDIETIRGFGKKEFAESFRKGKSKQRPPIKIYGKTGLFMLILAFGLLSGCEAIEEHFEGKPDHHVTRVLHDRTLVPKNQQQFDVVNINSFLMDLWGIKEINPPRTQVDFYLSSIDDKFIQEDKYLRLEKGKPKSTRVEWEREDSIKVFGSEVLQLLTENISSGEGKDQSKINLCICRNLNSLSKADTNAIKTLIVMSDFLEHSRNSFYPLENEPHKLVGSDYERLAKAFSEECPLKDLSGIKVIGVFTPATIEQDEFIQYAVKFWEKYLTAHGAEFSFRANF